MEKIRDNLGSDEVSIMAGSPIAASMRSAALAYAILSVLHKSKYSMSDISASLVNFLTKDDLKLSLRFILSPITGDLLDVSI